jgi:bifunctional UDP-N-acetylglucosamine pyrophosphorylase/glucosamine-1-phosphate N-acetyltransferase
MHKKGYVVRSFMAEDQAEVMGVNDRWELAIAENVIRLRILERLAKEGNTIHQPETVWIEPSVVLEGEVEIEPGVALRGNTKIGKGVRIGRGSVIENSVVEEGAVIEPYSIIQRLSHQRRCHCGTLCPSQKSFRDRGRLPHRELCGG